jgi:DNA-binding IscR family transcriptional regulator
LPAFVDTTVKDIDARLRELQDEVSRLEAARTALTGGRRRPGRPRRATARATGGSAGTTGASTRTTRARTGRRASAGPRTRPTRRGGNTRAVQALELVRERPGITIPEIAKAMRIEPNYLYRVLPRLASEGSIKRDGQGWHPAPSSAAKPANATDNATGRRQARAANSKSTASATRGARPRQRAATSATNGRTAPGATKASVLAALAGGDSMTAGQVAAKAGLARPTVSTTLSKLAKTGEVQKAERGYRLTPAP